ncbi:MAG: hypothetical protein C5B51_11690 [Terriglobia bacterium]|nr:MAG: hypothetical protein C5B51_11690 [Terriglobia bacterium]
MRYVVLIGIACCASGQQRPTPDPPENHRPPLFFREAWKHSGTPEHPISQDSVASPNLELKLYGDPPRPDPEFGGIWDNKRPQPLDDPAHTFTGTCRRPCGLTLRDRENYADLSGLGKIQWRVKAEGFHQLRPLLKLADGTYLVGDHADGYSLDWHIVEFSLADLRWRRLDPEKVVTMTGAQAGWVVNPDLSKVDEIGFVDLMPGSGHGNGGWTDLAWMEVYGRPVPRATNKESR